MKITLNLASRTYLNRRGLYITYAIVSGILVLLLALSGFFHALNRERMQQLRTHLSTLQQEAAASTASGQETVSPAAYEKLLAEIRLTNEILAQDSFRWTTLLGQLEDVVPKTVAIDAIQPDFKQNSLNLTGTAKGVEDLQQFLDNLIASTHFKDVYLLQQSRLKGTVSGVAAEGISFRLIVRGAF